MISPSPERPFTDDYLLAYSGEHVAYEFDMFLWCAEVCGSGAGLGAPTVADATRLSNVLIEAFVVHLRNVLDFLFLERPKKTDVVAADFLDPGGWKGLRPPISAALENARVRANKEVAHLTTDRKAESPPAKAWDFTHLAAEIRPIMRLVAKHGLPSRLSPKVSTVIR